MGSSPPYNALGDVIFRQKPYAFAYSSDRLDVCHFCAKIVPKTSRCTACTKAIYCGKECQQKDWPTHKKVCPSLKKLSSTPLGKNASTPALIRLLLRFVREREAARTEGSKNATKDDDYNDILAMTEASSSKKAEGAEEYAQALHSFLPSNVAAHITVEEIMDICKRTIINSFEVPDGRNDALATATYASASLFNHACRPNAWAYFDEQTLAIRIVAIKDILPSEEVCISYVPNAETHTEIKNRMGFDCQCDYCLQHPVSPEVAQEIAELDEEFRIEQLQTRPIRNTQDRIKVLDALQNYLTMLFVGQSHLAPVAFSKISSALSLRIQLGLGHLKDSEVLEMAGMRLSALDMLGVVPLVPAYFLTLRLIGQLQLSASNPERGVENMRRALDLMQRVNWPLHVFN